MKNDKKKIIFIIICLLIIIAVIAVCIITARGRKRHALKSEDMPVSAYYIVDGNDIKVSLAYPKGSDYRWAAECDNPEVTGIKDIGSSKRDVFLISSKKALTISNVRLSLQNKNDSSDKIYQIVIGLFSDKKKKLSVQEVLYIKIDSVINGSVADHGYKLITGVEGEVYLEIEDDAASPLMWEYESRGSLLSVGGPSYSDGKVSFVFKAVQNEGENERTEDSSETVLVYSEDILSGLILTFRITPDYSVSVESHTAEAYEIPKVTDEEAKKYFTDKYGDITLPADAVKIVYSEKSLRVSKDAEDYIDAANIEFRLNGAQFDIMFTDLCADESAFSWRIGSEPAETESINGVAVTFFAADGDVVAVWSKDGRIFGFFTDGMDVKEAAVLLKEIV